MTNCVERMMDVKLTGACGPTSILPPMYPVLEAELYQRRVFALVG